MLSSGFVMQPIEPHFDSLACIGSFPFPPDSCIISANNNSVCPSIPYLVSSLEMASRYWATSGETDAGPVPMPSPEDPSSGLENIEKIPAVKIKTITMARTEPAMISLACRPMGLYFNSANFSAVLASCAFERGWGILRTSTEHRQLPFRYIDREDNVLVSGN